MNTNQIEKHIELKAPVSRVWRALTNHIEFGQWFEVKLESAFVVGKVVKGKIPTEKYGEIQFEATVQKMEPETLFSYTWHPFSIDPKKDYSKETPTLVEFRLKPIKEGTLLTVTETGFDKLPADRRADAFRMHNEGWVEQLENISRHVTKT